MVLVYLARRDAKCLYFIPQYVEKVRVLDAGNRDCYLEWYIGCSGVVSVGICILLRCSRFWSIVYLTTCVFYLSHLTARECIDIVDGRWRFLRSFSGQTYRSRRKMLSCRL